MAPPLDLAALLAAESYPGIDDAEWPVIRDWLRVYGCTYDALEFNARIGEGRPATAEDSDATKRMWKAVTQVRADVLAWRGHDVDVIEAKVHATLPATSQVRRYRALLRLDARHVGRVTPVLICRTCRMAVEVSMEISGGRVHRIPAAS